MRTEHSEDYYYKESKRLRAEVLRQAEALIGHPIHVVVENVITMNVEITKSDLKTIVSKASRDNQFNAIKNELAKDIIGFLRNSEYLGWRSVLSGKHGESAYFVYFDHQSGVEAILAMRKMKNGGPYKPYAIMDRHTFTARIDELKKGTPL